MAVKATWNSQELDEKGWISPHCEPAGRCLGNAMLGKIPAGTGRVFGRLIFSLILTTVLNEVAAISCLTTSHISDLTSKYRWSCLRSLRVSHTHTHTHTGTLFDPFCFGNFFFLTWPLFFCLWQRSPPLYPGYACGRHGGWCSCGWYLQTQGLILDFVSMYLAMGFCGTQLMKVGSC